ncbi:hypothetical protein PAXRUDRAFT_822894 [Paxillus rubicundulus Ve08.2h10]|uniref:Unplaced genomic scaffold scaffold_41, whole genome shotgun sequence n=1 Tax=Paxillus rubicundulus Ve08.2h10 TaxID=930991 RepID=A0A0D0DL87_9AGAM|nr:hypothetical protein PAXRUDRAFT_822894 [Paxillus rubicundulus Ve08.2h10]
MDAEFRNKRMTHTITGQAQSGHSCPCLCPPVAMTPRSPRLINSAPRGRSESASGGLVEEE